MAGDAELAHRGLREGVGYPGVAAASQTVGGAGGAFGGVGVAFRVGRGIGAGAGGDGGVALGGVGPVEEDSVLGGGEAMKAYEAVVILVGEGVGWGCGRGGGGRSRDGEGAVLEGGVQFGGIA